MVLKQLDGGFGGLPYIVLDNVPIRDSQYGEIIDMDYGELEILVARKLITERVPIRGREVRFLRKVFGFSMARFGEIISYSSTAIMKWEQSLDKRLDPANEIMVRALFAEFLKIDLVGHFSTLLGGSEVPKILTVDVPKRAA